METRVCKKCGVEKLLEQFGFGLGKKRLDGSRGKFRIWTCKSCVNITAKSRHKSRKNRKKSDEAFKERWRIARQTGKFTPKQLEQLKKKQLHTNKYHASRKLTDPTFRLKCNIRNRVSVAIKRKSLEKKSKFTKYIGCSVKELKEFLERQFNEKMNWSNYGSYWSIDHIIPLSYADTEEELYKLCHYINLRPILAIQNIARNNRLGSEDISLYLNRLKDYASKISK